MDIAIVLMDIMILRIQLFVAPVTSPAKLVLGVISHHASSVRIHPIEYLNQVHAPVYLDFTRFYKPVVHRVIIHA